MSVGSAVRVNGKAAPGACLPAYLPAHPTAPACYSTGMLAGNGDIGTADINTSGTGDVYLTGMSGPLRFSHFFIPLFARRRVLHFLRCCTVLQLQCRLTQAACAALD